MPSGDRRSARAKKLIRAYMQVTRLAKDRFLRCKASLQRRLRQVNRGYPTSQPLLDDFDDFDDFDNTLISPDDEMSLDLEDPPQRPFDTSILDIRKGKLGGLTGRSLGMTLEMPALDGAVGDETDFNMIEGEELASDLLDWRIGIDLDGLREDGGGSRQLRRWVVQELQGMYAQRYEVPRNTLPRGPSYLSHVLHALKNSRADHFRQALRVTPLTFDALVAAIEDDPIFHNHSGNGQLPVEEQLAILLYRFGHDGNAAGLQGIANWAGVGKGTVVLVTRRVMTAILRPEFMKKAVRMPTPEEKEDAKRWVQQHSCRAWRNGWSFVDGTLVPLSNRPAWFGESYYDRKNHYSLNFQVVSLPNLRIIDYSFGYPGSRHDSVAWKATQLYLEHETLLEDDEWVWADSAYPIETWVVSPYKAPEKHRPKNEIFNKHVSVLRIRSEHAIGYLKGRFQSLKNLRVRITSKETHIAATYWGAACIGIHNFALEHEAEERRLAEPDADEYEYHDRFIDEGLSDSEAEEDGDGEGSSSDEEEVVSSRCSRRLRLGKKKREDLKKKLLASKKRRLDQQAENRARMRRDELEVSSDFELDDDDDDDDNDD